MKSINIGTIAQLLTLWMIISLLSSCNKGDEGFPITHDLRVLQVKTGNSVITSGKTDISVLSRFELIFSHGLNQTDFEAGFSITPSVNYTLTYDNTKSFVTLDFTTPLQYETMYTFSLPTGTYGANGEASVDDFVFEFITTPFVAPNVVLSGSESVLFEGNTYSILATLTSSIALDVKMDLVFAGTAEFGTDFSVTSEQLVIPAGSTSGFVEISALTDADFEGEESIVVKLENIQNAESNGQPLNLILKDLPPALEFKGVMSLKIGGTDTNGRAIHLKVLEDVTDLSQYGIGIANNGGGTDGREIDFPAISVSLGDDILLIRDIDLASLEGYFGDCWQEFEHIVESGGLNFNGDDPFELYNGAIVIETYGDVEISGAGLEWEWTGSWAYKLGDAWEYAPVDCSAGAVSNADSGCHYPFCQALQLESVLALLWDGSGTNGGKGIQVRANRDIPDLSLYSIGVANNGGGTDGIEFTFPQMAFQEGAHFLLAREPETIASYFGTCYSAYDHILQADAMNQNGDDAIELFKGDAVIETFGDADVDGTDQPWEYTGSWAFKQSGVWVYGGIDCAAGSISTQSSSCPFPFCN